MTRPTYREPRTSLIHESVAPAPDNGVPFGKPPRASKPARAGRQLGHRIPEDLYQRLVAVSEETDIPVGRLITRAIKAEVARHEGR